MSFDGVTEDRMEELQGEIGEGEPPEGAPRNDVAPSAYNENNPPGGLPASPLAPRPEATGFLRAA